jgi:hypothetical protein
VISQPKIKYHTQTRDQTKKLWGNIKKSIFVF